jgi:hypothetical protein
MTPLFARHRADNGGMLHGLGHLGKVFGNLDSRHAGRNRLGFTAIGMTRLRAKGLELARATLHPEQDAGHAAAAEFVGLCGHQVGPAQRAGCEACGGNTAQEVAAANNVPAIYGGVDTMVELEE